MPRTALLTAVMGVSMLQLFLIGALAPYLVADGSVSRGLLGLTTTAGFLVAAVLSPAAGTLVDRIGPRRAIVALGALAAVALMLIGVAPGPAALLAAVALGGLPQAMANPATNKVIIAAFEPVARATATGWKQSGVQLGALAAGLPLAGLAAWAGWRAAVWAAAGTALAVALWAWRILPADPARRPVAPVAGGGRVGRWAAYCLFLGCGVASVNTYLTLFAAQRLSLAPVIAGWLVAMLGIAGIAGRVGWSRRAGTLERPDALLWLLAACAGGAALVLAACAVAGPPWGTALVWPAAAGIGAFAAAGNAVAMVAVVRHAQQATAGRDSARVSAGFFAGFALGPPLFAVAVEASGYGAGWAVVSAEFLTAMTIMVVRREKVRA
ncbi:hypothetical protein Aph01nite_19510 [Acrocarpospora phusangensis]|uniref:Major facilitator superfamily (MFS) profile domain-containing protein n=1 Tax=Acrocarpospora phusangensis TaxID=1070424 RepID=A0A919UJB5_9ACTN|nr:MFS transporter [Acrocarpospora phusangensis]GIH23641.1 hypothetical protein Aph01nite_19510 [Acrocarpospora phusangensis]